MLIRTQAICLKTFAYKESSTIVSLYTQELGLKSCIIKGGRKKNATVKSSFFQPLQLLDIVLYDNNKSSFCQIKECNIAINLSSIYTDIIKISLSFFITEVLNLSIKEDNPSEEIFTFLKNSIIYLQDCDNNKNLKDFHIYFLYHLATLLGFSPMNNYSEYNPFFDISKGEFVEKMDIQTLDNETSLLFYEFINKTTKEYSSTTNNSLQRNTLLNTFILFFEQHITNNRQIKSQKILHTIF